MLMQSDVNNEYSINVVVYIHIGVDSTINSSSCVYVRCLCECVCSKHVIVMTLGGGDVWSVSYVSQWLELRLI